MLRRGVWAPGPPGDARFTPQQSEGPSSICREPMQLAIRSMWKQTLGVPQEEDGKEWDSSPNGDPLVLKLR